MYAYILYIYTLLFYTTESVDAIALSLGVLLLLLLSLSSGRRIITIDLLGLKISPGLGR